MAATAIPRPKRAYTPDELLCMPDGFQYELIDGELKERNMGQESSGIALFVNGPLAAYARTRGLGWVAQSDTGFPIFPSPKTTRFADGSFTSWDRLPNRKPFAGQALVAPDLVLEVVSPNDLVEEVDEKAALWLSVGVRMVWVAHPRQRYVQVWRADGSMSVRREGETLDGEDVVPGFSLPIADAFPTAE